MLTPCRLRGTPGPGARLDEALCRKKSTVSTKQAGFPSAPGAVPPVNELGCLGREGGERSAAPSGLQLGGGGCSPGPSASFQELHRAIAKPDAEGLMGGDVKEHSPNTRG